MKLAVIVAGVACMVFGVVSALTHASATHPVGFAIWFAGAAVAHDFGLAPLVFAVALVGVRRVPARWRAPVQAVAIVSGAVALVALPFAAGFGDRPDDPSALPLPYTRNLAIVLAAIWAPALVAMLVRRRR